MIKNELGNRYGLLTVVALHVRPKDSRNRAYWICKCDCGNEKSVLGSHLRSGEIISCCCVGRAKKADAAPKRLLIGTWRDRVRASTLALEIRRDPGDKQFIRPHVYRKPRKLDKGPIVQAALEAVYERRWRGEASR